MTAFDLQDEYDRYRSEGGRASFSQWASRYGDDYGCDAEWLVEDYLSFWRLNEARAELRDESFTPPSFRAWLESETAEYRAAHMDDEVAA